MTTALRPARDGERTASLLEHAVTRAGVYKGARACEVVWSWAMAELRLGHELGADEGGHMTAAMREYSDYWKCSERSAWRQLKRFREVFPEEESPARLAGYLRNLLDERQAQGAGSMAAMNLRLAL